MNAANEDQLPRHDSYFEGDLVQFACRCPGGPASLVGQIEGRADDGYIVLTRLGTYVLPPQELWPFGVSSALAPSPRRGGRRSPLVSAA